MSYGLFPTPDSYNTTPDKRYLTCKQYKLALFLLLYSTNILRFFKLTTGDSFKTSILNWKYYKPKDILSQGT